MSVTPSRTSSSDTCRRYPFRSALLLLAAGATTPAAVAAGWEHVHELQRDMAESRQARLGRLGFTSGEAEALGALHTRNFM